MPKHQAPRSWAITRVTELPARACWAPSSSCWNAETRSGEAGVASAPATGTAAQPQHSRPSSGQTGSGRGAPPGRIQQAQRAAGSGRSPGIPEGN
jgi:hypothetical protein